jgi:hypothetical protein
MRLLKLIPILSLAFMIPVLSGCGGTAEAEVAGTVNIDNKPLAEGEIIFESSDGSVTPAAGQIREGQYRLKVLPGPKKVKITASRPTKIPDPVMGAAAREALISPEFNVETKLTADIKPGMNEGVNFEVISLP